MIVTETVEVNGSTFIHNYSDQNLMICKVDTEEIYCDAYDLPDLNFVYKETNVFINIE